MKTAFASVTTFLLIALMISVSYSDELPNLAEQYPNETLFVAMMMRGANDYSTINQRFADNISEFVEAGYTAYLQPAGSGFQYYVEGDRAVCYSGDLGYTDGVNDRPPVTNRIKVMPKEETFTVGTGMVPIMEGGEVSGFEEIETKNWTYNGSKWYDAGSDWETVSTALRFERIWAHLSWATMSYQTVARDMPSSMFDLESFIGISRNPPAWIGVLEVNSPDVVEDAAGNLYVGWVDEAWIVKMNVGPDIREASFEKDSCSLMYSCPGIRY